MSIPRPKHFTKTGSQRCALRDKIFYKKIGVERRLPRSYVTIEEARTKAKALFASSQVVQNQVPQDTVAPGSLASATSGPGVLPLGDAEVIDLEPSKPTPENEEVRPIKKPRAKSKNQTTQKSLRLGPPDELGKLS